jgi:calcium permeable stress-gated cation channel
MPEDISNAGRSPTTDAELFPSDEQLSQRTLWMTFLIVAGWSVLGLAGALPLYLIYTPCLAQSAPTATYIGAYSVLQDLSLIRLLQLLDDGPTTSIRLSLFSRDVNSSSRRNVEIRLIVLTIFAIVLALLPALYKTLKEFTRTVAYRERWLTVHCDGLEMGWLSARVAPGFRGWGEQRIKEFITKTGLSSSLDSQPSRNDASGSRRRRQRDTDLRREEEVNLEIDIQSLFSVVLVSIPVIRVDSMLIAWSMSSEKPEGWQS